MKLTSALILAVSHGVIFVLASSQDTVPHSFSDFIASVLLILSLGLFILAFQLVATVIVLLGTAVIDYIRWQQRGEAPWFVHQISNWRYMYETFKSEHVLLHTMLFASCIVTWFLVIGFNKIVGWDTNYSLFFTDIVKLTAGTFIGVNLIRLYLNWKHI